MPSRQNFVSDIYAIVPVCLFYHKLFPLRIAGQIYRYTAVRRSYQKMDQFGHEQAIKPTLRQGNIQMCWSHCNHRDCRTQLEICKDNQTELEQQNEDHIVELNTCQGQLRLALSKAEAKSQEIGLFSGEGTQLALLGGAGLLLGLLLGGALAAWCWYRNKVTESV